MKRLMKAFSDGSAILRGWRMTGLLRGSMLESALVVSVGRLWKRRIDTVKECLKKRGLDVRQARRMVCDRSIWQGFVRGTA